MPRLDPANFANMAASSKGPPDPASPMTLLGDPTSSSTGGLRARLEDPLGGVFEEEDETDPHEVQFFTDLVRRFVRAAIVGRECSVVSLKTGVQRGAIYKVNKELNTFFLIDNESKKSDLWAMSAIEVKPAPAKWALAYCPPEDLAHMALVDYHPDTRIHVFVVVHFASKEDRDLFYGGMKILRLYALKGDVPVEPNTVMSPPSFEPTTSKTDDWGNDPPPPDIFGK